MADHVATATQTRYPWRAVLRTGLAVVAALASAAPIVYSAITEQDPSLATGGALVALTIAGAVTRVLALPVVEDFLAKFLPWLAAEPKSGE